MEKQPPPASKLVASEATNLISPASTPRSLPWYLRTPCLKWTALVFITVASSFAQLDQMAWQTLQPQMLNTGIFQCDAADDMDDVRNDAASSLDDVFNVGLGLNSAMQLFIGLLFDAIGPRALGVTFGVLSIVGYSLTALSLMYPCDMGNFIWASQLNFIAGPALSLGANAYLYFLHDHAFVVSAVTNSAFVLAQAYGVIGGEMDPSSGFTVDMLYWAVAVCSAYSTLAFLFLIPRHDLYRVLQEEGMAQCQTALLGSKDGGSAAGTAATPSQPAPNPLVHEDDAADERMGCAPDACGPGGICVSPLDYFRCRRLGIESWRSLYEVYVLIIYSPKFGLAGHILALHIFTLYMQQVVFLIEQYLYYEAIGGVEMADDLVNTYAIIFSAAGIPISLAYGAVADRMPPFLTLVVWDVLALAFFVTTYITTLPAQYASMSFLTLGQNVYYIATPVLVMLFAPAELFGALFGSLQGAIGLLQIAIVYIEDFISDGITDSDIDQVRGKLVGWSAVLLVAAVANQIIWRRTPPPALGSVTMSHLRELAGTTAGSAASDASI